MDISVKTSSAYFETLFKSTRDFLFVVNAHGVITRASSGLHRLLGFKSGALVGEQFSKFVSGEPAGDAAGRAMYYSLQSGEQPIDIELLHPEGRTIPVRLHSVIVRDEAGSVVEAVGMVDELTSCVAAVEEQLWEVTENLRSVLENSGDGIVVHNETGLITLVNKAFLEMIGCREDEVLGRHLLDLSPVEGSFVTTAGEEVTLKEDNVQYLMEQSQVLFELGRVTYRLYYHCKDGRIVPVEATYSILNGKQGERRGSIGIVRDITERTKIEKELLRTKRLETIAAMAGGVAQDFDMILTTLLGSITAAQDFCEEDDVRTLLGKAEKDAMRAKDLTRQLLTFSQKLEVVKKEQPITDVLTGVAQQVLRGSDLRCEFDFEADLWPLAFDRELISQVITSLIINIDYSMPEGGVLSIGASNELVDASMRLPLPAGRYLKIALQDEGVGILNEYIQDIFSQYFKQGRKRSGLVLAAAYSIINKHGGLISVESEFGAGTAYYIYLPALQAAADPGA